MIVSNNTIQAEGLGSFFEIMARTYPKAGKKLATNITKTQVHLWKSLQTLLPQLQLQALKQHCHHYLK